MQKVSDASSEERMDFAQKVYGIVGVQLGVTAMMCLAAMKSTAFLAILAQPALCILSLIGVIVISCMFACSKDMRSNVPTNYCLLLLFTIFEGHTVAIACAVYDPEVVVLALIATAGIFLVVTGYAITAKRDFTIAWQIMLTLALASLFVGIVRIFYNTAGMELVGCFVGILAGCYYILYDTQMIFGGYQHSFELDDYILAALNIYVDIIILFLKLLKFLDKLRNDKDKKEKS